ncbi:MAG: hypothetical protein WCQ47_07610 [bacterium]
MSKKTTQAMATVSIILFLSGCLGLNDPTTSGSNGTQTKLFAYFISDNNKLGCYGNPDDTTLAGKVIPIVYNLVMQDSNTVLVCVVVPASNGGTVPSTVLANKTITFYASNTPAVTAGEGMDLSAHELPVADQSTAFYVTGRTGTTCPNGTTGTLVGRLDVTQYLPLKYIKLYDECGTCVGSSMTPMEEQRQIDQGFK